MDREVKRRIRIRPWVDGYQVGAVRMDDGVWLGFFRHGDRITASPGRPRARSPQHALISAEDGALLHRQWEGKKTEERLHREGMDHLVARIPNV